MKFFVSVFLLIVGLLSFLKIAFSLQCHKTANFDVRDCWGELNINRSDGSEDKAISNFFVCLRNVLKERTDRECPRKDTTSCYTIIYELKDETQFMIRHCNDTHGTTENCPHDKETFDHTFAFGHFIKSSRCDYCSSDNCNDQKTRDKPSLSALSPGVAGLKCHYSAHGCDKYGRESDIIDCVRHASKVDKFGQCPPFTTACLSAIIKLDDGEELVDKDCAGPETADCRDIRMFFGRDNLKKCEMCETNFCNGETPSEPTNDGPTHSGPSHSQEPHSEEKHSRETHSGRSHSLATSSAPTAFGILIFKLLVHFIF